MNLSDIKKAHFVGVGGIGVSAILRLFAERGIHVSGSDMHLPPRETLPPGEYFDGHRSENLSDDVDVVIYSPAVPEHNPERKKARDLRVKELSYPEALALVTRDHNTIAVSGTHGKSTTTALIGKLFERGGLHPSVIVGAEVPGWEKRNLLIGSSDIFIVEACEYRRSMLNLSPQTIVLTNIELDHPDYYHDLADVKSAFREYVAKLRQEDLLVVNNDDANVREVARGFDGIIVRYGVGEGPDLYASSVIEYESSQSFELVWKGTSLGTFSTELPGIYNLYNILASISVYLSYGGQTEAIQGVLSGFHGVGRRFEVLGHLNETLVVSDYAHHPTALRAVTDAARSRYKGKRILTVFRPHHRERTIKLFSEFVDVISGIPEMILIEIYDVAGREESTPISSRDIIARVKERHADAPIEYAADLTEAERMIRDHAENFDVILVIGAGDADQLAKELIS
jgi:UDP-N-acetylmuramate--alanine ligase